MSRIFISYSRTDEEFARWLAGELDQLGANVWIDVDEIPAGMKWSTAIQQGLRACEAMIVIISPESMSSRNVEDEWQYYLDKDKPVIPILLREADDVHFQLNRIQYIDFLRQNQHTALDLLSAELARKGIQLSDPAAVRFDVGAALGQFYAAASQEQWTAALDVLRQIRESGQAPRTFDVDGLEQQVLEKIQLAARAARAAQPAQTSAPPPRQTEPPKPQPKAAPRTVQPPRPAQTRRKTKGNARQRTILAYHSRLSGYYWANRFARGFTDGLQDVLGESGYVAVANHAAQQYGVTLPHPADNLERLYDFTYFTALQVALEDLFGPRADGALARHAGKALYTQHFQGFGALAAVSDLAFKVLPLAAKLQIAVPAIANILTQFSDQISNVHESKNGYVFTVERCPMCWNRTAGRPVCYPIQGILQAGLRHTSGGYVFNVALSQCIAVGDKMGQLIIDREPVN